MLHSMGATDALWGSSGGGGVRHCQGRRLTCRKGSPELENSQSLHSHPTIDELTSPLITHNYSVRRKPRRRSRSRVGVTGNAHGGAGPIYCPPRPAIPSSCRHRGPATSTAKIRNQRAYMNGLSCVARPDHSCRRALRSAHVDQPSPT
jgi:hypothetical protein